MLSVSVYRVYAKVKYLFRPAGAVETPCHDDCFQSFVPIVRSQKRKTEGFVTSCCVGESAPHTSGLSEPLL